MRKFCLIALFIASYLTIGAQKCFQYPFNQGDAKWKTFSSSKERIVALQIPEKPVLADMLSASIEYKDF